MIYGRKGKIFTRYLKLPTGVFLLIICLVLAAYSNEKKVLFREDFHNLEKWKPLYFKKIKNHTTYTVASDGNGDYLKAESHSSASALVCKEEFDVYKYPKARWRWKIGSISIKGDPLKKSGDDYPNRVYFLFKYEPENASFTEKIKYALLKNIYGEYPPHSSLNYVWSYTEKTAEVFSSPYTDKTKILVLEKGDKYVGQWMTEDVNILEDYQKAFGKKPPAVASIAVMNDSDNTGGEAVSYIDFIEVYRDGP